MKTGRDRNDGRQPLESGQYEQQVEAEKNLTSHMPSNSQWCQGPASGFEQYFGAPSADTVSGQKDFCCKNSGLLREDLVFLGNRKIWE